MFDGSMSNDKPDFVPTMDVDTLPAFNPKNA